jgi:two-component system, OmpR family, phosphate regulon response regulator OmpR
MTDKAPTLTDDAAHLLVVDDDRRIRALLQRFLSASGYRITTAPNAAEARLALESLVFDLIVLDVMMPGESGLSLAQSLRKTSQVPILMLTARAEAEDRVRGLETGVDDYLTKPFETRELLLRIASILRRSAPPPAPPPPAPIARFGGFVFHLERLELKRGEEIIRLTERERDIIALLARTPGETVSREALGGSSAAENERTIDVQINRLRRKIEIDPANPQHLHTVRGAGYRLLTDR